MKIAMFIPSLIITGGAERVFITLANWFAKNNHSVVILTVVDSEPFYEIDKRVKMETMGMKYSKSFIVKLLKEPYLCVKYTHSLVKIVKEYNIDIVLSFLHRANRTNVFARWFTHKPAIISERDDPLFASLKHRILSRWIYPKADTIVCQSEEVEKYFLSMGAKCKVLPNPLNTAALGEFIENKTKRIVSVGRLAPEKNHRMLIEAFSMIYPAHRDYSLVIIGEGPLKEELEKQIKDLDLQGAVHIHKNMKNVMTKVNDAACFVLPSDTEGMPNVLIEAMGSGMPVVSTDFRTRVARNLIQNGVNGFVVPVGNTKNMAEAIDMIISSKELQVKMGLENLKIRDLLGEEKICSQWEAFFQQMIETHPSRAPGSSN